MIERAKLLAEWIQLKHEGQLIRSTNIPYFDHLKAVADMAAPVARLGYEIGLCHDLFEKTPTSAVEFENALLNFGYSVDEASFIIGGVTELTDVFTKAAYPHLPKAGRKEKEALRLAGISAEAQTVKYADLIYNIKWVLQYAKSDAEKYLQKKRELIISMSAGDIDLKQQALSLIAVAIQNLCIIR